jgi:hypothetical protein
LFAAVGPFTLETAEVGRNTIGSNQLPAAAVFASAKDEIAFAGRARDAARFVELAEGLSGLDPAFRAWALRRPLKLLELGTDALTAARVALWLRDNPEPGVYVRQLSLPGVHTKFVETHRRVIDELAEALSAPSADNSSTAMNSWTMFRLILARCWVNQHALLPPVSQHGTGSCIRPNSSGSGRWIQACPCWARRGT